MTALAISVRIASAIFPTSSMFMCDPPSPLIKPLRDLEHVSPRRRLRRFCRQRCEPLVDPHLAFEAAKQDICLFSAQIALHAHRLQSDVARHLRIAPGHGRFAAHDANEVCGVASERPFAKRKGWRRRGRSAETADGMETDKKSRQQRTDRCAEKWGTKGQCKKIGRTAEAIERDIEHNGAITHTHLPDKSHRRLRRGE